MSFRLIDKGILTHMAQLKVAAAMTLKLSVHVSAISRFALFFLGQVARGM